MATKTNPLNKNQVKLLSGMKHMSTKIRYLLSIGWERGRIAKELGIIYQWVYNVEHQKVKNPKV